MGTRIRELLDYYLVFFVFHSFNDLMIVPLYNLVCMQGYTQPYTNCRNQDVISIVQRIQIYHSYNKVKADMHKIHCSTSYIMTFNGLIRFFGLHIRISNIVYMYPLTLITIVHICNYHKSVD